MSLDLSEVQSAAEGSDGGIEIVALPSGDPTALFQAGLTTLAHTGFVPVIARHDSSPDLSSALLHRHVLVVCADAAGERVAINWIRSLALTSPRRHLLALRGDQRQDLAVQGDDNVGRRSAFVSSRLARADRWRRRGRARTALSWLRAAAHGARRRGEDALAAQIEIRCAQLALDRDGVDEAARQVRSLLRTHLDWVTHWTAAVLWADVLLSRGQCSHARAWLTSVEAEAKLRRAPVPGQVRARFAEMDFWQGRHPSPPPHAAPIVDADEIGWRALSAWSRGDQAGLTLLVSRDLARSRPAGGAGGDDHWWDALLQVAMAGEATEEEIRRRIEALAAAGRHRRARDRRLGSVMSARLWLLGGKSGLAAEALEAARGPGPEGEAGDQLRVRLNARPIPTPLRRPPRTMPGVEYLASRSMHMQLIDGLSGLLAVIEDAEDDAGVLAGGCKWVCRQTGATAVAVVSADRTTLVVAEGWRRADLAGDIADILQGPSRDARLPEHDAATGALGMSVRYGGHTIGHVVARGRPTERPALQQAVQAFAALCGSALRARLDALSAPQRTRELMPDIVGESQLMQAVRDAVARAALAPFPVLIEGESGTGKELVARALHRLGPRRDRKFCAVNCAALTDDLVEAELFGHTRGAFTGAIGPRAGLFEEASGGTLFLDEVTELSPRAQAKLLRVLQEREIRRVGENAARAIDVRVIAATNVNLAEAVALGRFRDDLRFRLAVVRIRLPPLRERVEDVAPLARLFWRRSVGEAGTRASLGPDALLRLSRHSWPGNVRELQNVIAGLVVAVPTRGRVGARHVDQVLAHGEATGDVPIGELESARRTFERRVIAAALVRHAGRRSAAAMELGLTRQGLAKAVRRLGLAVEGEEDAAGVA